MTPTANAHERFVQILRQTVGAVESDAALLARFVEKRDEAAFAAIVERHGPLVLGVCRRMLGDSADADDAFQAVFLALVRNARRIRKGDSLAAWLYGAAHRVCQKARRSHARIRAIERKAKRRNSADPLAEITVREFLALLDDELARLPDRLRLPLVLCLVEGLSQNEAAERLGCSPGAIKGRLERGREKLRLRLAARGVTLAAAVSASALGSSHAALPPALFARAAGVVSGITVPEAVAKLAAAAVRSSTIVLRISAVVLLGAAISIAAVLGSSQQPEPKPAAEKPGKSEKPTARVDRFGDPLPEGALMRLGTVQFRVPGLTSIGFRPDGDLVGLDTHLNLHVWSPDGKSKPVITNILNSKSRNAAAWISGDARFVQTYSGDQKFTVWDISGKQPVEYLTRPVHAFMGTCFSPDGQWLAIKDERTPGKDTLSICNLRQKTWIDSTVQVLPATPMSFSADGKLLVVADLFGVAVIDTATGKEIFHAKNLAMRPQFAAVSPDGKIVAVQPESFTRGPEVKVLFLSVPSGKEVAGLKPPAGAAQWINFSPDGKTVLRGGPSGIQIWDPVAGKVVREIEGPAMMPAIYSGDRRRLASHSGSALLYWDVANGRPVRPDLENVGHFGRVDAIAASPNGQLIATSNLYEGIRVWDAANSKQKCRIRTSWAGELGFAFLPDSKSLVALANDNLTPTVFDATTGEELRRFKIPPEMAKSEMTGELQLSQDGKTLFTKSDPLLIYPDSKSYRLRWDVAAGTILSRVQHAIGPVNRDPGSTALSPDGRWLVKKCKALRVGTNESTQLIPSFECPFSLPRFSADSRLVVLTRTPTAGRRLDYNHCSLVIFDLNSMAKIADLPTNHTVGGARLFSPDGRQIAVAGPNQLTVWDLASAQPVRRFAAPARTGAIAFTSDGRRLVTGHDDSTALVWDLTGLRDNHPAALAGDELTELWNSLASDDAAKAFTAIFELSDHPKQTVRFLCKQLKPVDAADAKRIRNRAASYVPSLDAKSFTEREKAQKELRLLGELAAPQLRAALKGNPSAEKKTRIERLLADAAKFVLPPGERLRQVWAIAVLEHIGTEDARKLLKELAGGLPEARQTREAVEALARLDRAAGR